MTAEMQGPVVERGDGRPDGGYKIDGKRVPGTTTVIGRFKATSNLMRWTWNQGIAEGRARAEAEAKGEDRTPQGQYHKRDRAGILGGYVHDAIECDLHGNLSGDYFTTKLSLVGEDLERCQRAYGAYAEWRRGVDFRLIATEVAMLSTVHRFGGTLDAVAMIDGQYCLFDWKTSNGVYSNYIVQLGAYAILWHEVRGKPFEGAHLLRFSKEDGSFEHHVWDRQTLQLGAEQFLAYRAAYDRDYQLTKLLRASKKAAA